MNIFLDTSSLVKLYHEEDGTEYLDNIFRNNKIQTVFISELAIIEFVSAIYKKSRTKEITFEATKAITNSFEKDIHNYSLVKINNELIINSKKLITKYGAKGLRTLDSLQLSSIILIKDKLDLAITSDELLKIFISAEGIKTD